MYSKQPLALAGGKGKLRRGQVDWRQRQGVCFAGPVMEDSDA